MGVWFGFLENGVEEILENPFVTSLPHVIGGYTTRAITAA